MNIHKYVKELYCENVKYIQQGDFKPRNKRDYSNEFEINLENLCNIKSE